MAADLASHWLLDPTVTFLNHGSFGACPKAVLEEQTALRAELERQPIQFFLRALEPRLHAARAELARFVGASPDELAFVPNATAGVNTVLRSLTFQPGDELLTTNHAYNACRNALEYVAGRAGARVVVAEIPFPLRSSKEALAAVMSAVTPRTRLALIDHVTSPTGLVLPVAEIVRALATAGVDTLVDGAHAPGMLPLDVGAIGAAYYTGNCHKWLCAPKVAGFLQVREDKQAAIRPLSISHGANSPRTDTSRFHLEFDWTGTMDVTPYLCVPSVIRFMASLVPGGWTEVMRLNREKALAGRRVMCAALDVPPPCPDEMVGSLAAIPLPDGTGDQQSTPLRNNDPLQLELLVQHRIEVPIFPWPFPPKRLVRISAQLYNRPEQYVALGEALRSLLERERASA